MADILSEKFPEIVETFKRDFPVSFLKRKEPEPYILDSVVHRGSEEYEYLIMFVQQYLGDQSQQLLLHTANALLLILQRDQLCHTKKMQEIEDMLKLKQTIPEDTFHRLLSISTLKTDPLDFQNEPVERKPDVAPGCKLLDLERLASRQQYLDAQRMITCRLFSEHHPGYTELHVPPPLDLPSGDLLKIDTMPEIVQPAFHKLEQLNIIASQVYHSAFCTKDNILLCSPIGPWESDVAILTILEQIASNRNAGDSLDNNIVYITPTKASVTQVIQCLSSRLQHCDVEVKDLSQYSILPSQVQQTRILVSTPETWDVQYKQLRDQGYTALLKLFIIDKIHLLHDSIRGPLFECIVTRALRETKDSEAHVRFVGFCAPLPNSKDVASFLNVDPTKGLFYYNNSYRPCPLTQYHCQMYWCDPLKDFWLMEDLCYKKAMAAAQKHQVLIFVHSTTETTRTARNMLDTAVDSPDNFLKKDSKSHVVLTKHAEFIKSKDLKDLLSCGFAIYHAEMAREDCQVVENLFSDGHVRVLVATTDLAWSATLSADTVIIKGTQIYSNPDVLQMLSCAGRPQYGSHGEVSILSGRDIRYLALINEQLLIESQLVSKLHDRLKAEIILGTVKNTKEASDWIRCTYLYIRMLGKPTLYGLTPEELSRDNALTGRIADLVHSAATILATSNAIGYDLETGDFSL